MDLQDLADARFWRREARGASEFDAGEDEPAPPDLRSRRRRAAAGWGAPAMPAGAAAADAVAGGAAARSGAGSRAAAATAEAHTQVAARLALSESVKQLRELVWLCSPDVLREVAGELQRAKQRWDIIGLLPIELVDLILTFLRPPSLLTACCVCREWRARISESSSVWLRAFVEAGSALPPAPLAGDRAWTRCGETLLQRWVSAAPSELCPPDRPAAEAEKLPPQFWKERFVALQQLQYHARHGRHFSHVNDSHNVHAIDMCVVAKPDGRGHWLVGGNLTAKIFVLDLDSVPQSTVPGSETGPRVRFIEAHRCCCIVADASKIVSGSFDTTIVLWDFATGERRHTFRGHVGAVFAVAYNDELDVLASGSSDKSVRVWRLSSGNCLCVYPHGSREWATAVAIVPPLTPADGAGFVVAGHKYRLNVWPLPQADTPGAGGEAVEVASTLASVEFPSGTITFLELLGGECGNTGVQHVLVGGQHGISIYTVPSLVPVRRLVEDSITGTAAHGAFLACSYGNYVRLYSFATGALLHTFAFRSPVQKMVMIGTNQLCVSYTRGLCLRTLGWDGDH